MSESLEEGLEALYEYAYSVVWVHNMMVPIISISIACNNGDKNHLPNLLVACMAMGAFSWVSEWPGVLVNYALWGFCLKALFNGAVEQKRGFSLVLMTFMLVLRFLYEEAIPTHVYVTSLVVYMPIAVFQEVIVSWLPGWAASIVFGDFFRLDVPKSRVMGIGHAMVGAVDTDLFIEVGDCIVHFVKHYTGSLLRRLCAA